MRKYAITTPKGVVASGVTDLKEESFLPVILKAQIPLGGRGKAGGVLTPSTTDEMYQQIEHLLITKIRGYAAKKILIEEKVDIDRELFIAVTYDTEAKEPIAIFSCEGGVDIEALAEKEPDKVRKEFFTLRDGVPEYRAREIIAETGVTGRLLLGLGSVFSKLAKVFMDYDAIFRHQEMVGLQKDKTRLESGSSTTEFERKAAEIDNLDHRGVAGRVIEFGGSI